jgi:hypothetical protein
MIASYHSLIVYVSMLGQMSGVNLEDLHPCCLIGEWDLNLSIQAPFEKYSTT